jgi:hypothetical protein
MQPGEEGQVAKATGARRAIQWFLGTSAEEPSDADLLDLHWFLRDLMDRIDDGTELNLPEWEVLAAEAAQERCSALN